MSSTVDSAARAANHADRAYRQIRDGIVSGKYRPHQRLVETDLATEFAISRTPIRQSLQRLELEGLVLTSRVGWVVREHTADDIRHIYDVRVPLEGYAARLAAANASHADLERIQAAHRAATESLDPLKRGLFVELHDELHEAIVDAAGSPVLTEAIRQYRHHPYNRRIAHSYSDEEMRMAVQSHGELVDAIVEGDGDRAEMLAREHLILSRDATVQRLAEWG